MEYLDEQYEVGDLVVLRLTVEPVGGVPADDTTTASVVVIDPLGAQRTPSAFPDGPADRAHWSAALPVSVPGEYLARWTVTGTGEGVRSHAFTVAPEPADAGRTYATTADLARYLGRAPEPGSRRLLARATRKIDELCRTAIYPVDDEGMPLDPAVAAALRDATCAQVEWWAEIGDETGSGAVSALAGAQIGTVRLPGSGGGSSTGGSMQYAPEAISILTAAGLTSQGPIIPGPSVGGVIRSVEWA